MEIKNKLLFFVLIMTIIIQLSYGSDDNDKNFNKNFNDEKIQVITNKNSDIDSINETTTNTDVKTALLNILFETYKTENYNIDTYLICCHIISGNINIKSIDDFKIASLNSGYEAIWNIDLDKKLVELTSWNENTSLLKTQTKSAFFEQKKSFHILEESNELKLKENIFLNYCYEKSLFLFNVINKMDQEMQYIDNQIILESNKRSLLKFSVFIAPPFFVYVINPMVFFVGAAPWIMGYFTLSSFLQKTKFSTMRDKLYNKAIDYDKIKEDAKKYYEDTKKYYKKLEDGVFDEVDDTAPYLLCIPWDSLTELQKKQYIFAAKQASWRYKSFNNLILLTQLASLGLSMYGVNKILLYFKVRWYANARRYCSVHIVNPIRIITANSLLSNLADS